jgi:hypothetical protein
MRASMFVTIGIGGLAALVASGFVLAYAVAVSRTGGEPNGARRRARSLLLAWMVLFAVLAEKGVLARFDVRPPPLALAMIAFVASGLMLGLSPVGKTFARGLPIAWLVLAQAFRFPLELVMHQAALEGVMPNEMSFTGYNFDIVTGISALPIAWLAWKGRAPRALLYAWNVLGSVLLATIVTVAVLASPMVRAFGDDPRHINSWIAHFPFIWLGTVLVASAVFGHVVIFRALRVAKSAVPRASEPSSARASLPPS